MILTGCVAFARHVGPTRVEAELLPQCWEQVQYIHCNQHHFYFFHLTPLNFIAFQKICIPLDLFTFSHVTTSIHPFICLVYTLLPNGIRRGAGAYLQV